jgi:hypothetical protein
MRDHMAFARDFIRQTTVDAEASQNTDGGRDADTVQGTVAETAAPH